MTFEAWMTWMTYEAVQGAPAPLISNLASAASLATSFRFLSTPWVFLFFLIIKLRKAPASMVSAHVTCSSYFSDSRPVKREHIGTRGKQWQCAQAHNATCWQTAAVHRTCRCEAVQKEGHVSRHFRSCVCPRFLFPYVIDFRRCWRDSFMHLSPSSNPLEPGPNRQNPIEVAARRTKMKRKKKKKKKKRKKSKTKTERNPWMR